MREGFSARWSLIALVSSATVPSVDGESTPPSVMTNEVVFAFVSGEWSVEDMSEVTNVVISLARSDG
jgi:hypothetical protein